MSRYFDYLLAAFVTVVIMGVALALFITFIKAALGY